MTWAGFALPLVAFIAWPTSAPKAAFLAGAVVLDRLGVGGQHLVEDGLECAGVVHLLQALGLDDGVDLGGLAAPERIEDLAGGVVRDGAVLDAADQRAQQRRAHRRVGDVAAVGVQALADLAHHPVGHRPGRAAGG